MQRGFFFACEFDRKRGREPASRFLEAERLALFWRRRATFFVWRGPFHRQASHDITYTFATAQCIASCLVSPTKLVKKLLLDTNVRWNLRMKDSLLHLSFLKKNRRQMMGMRATSDRELQNRILLVLSVSAVAWIVTLFLTRCSTCH